MYYALEWSMFSFLLLDVLRLFLRWFVIVRRGHVLNAFIFENGAKIIKRLNYRNMRQYKV
jgi:hypothetical protein